MNRMLIKSAIAALALAAFGATGCAQQSKPSDFYLLSYEQPEQSGLETTMREGLAIGVGPIEFPPYLDRPQIVTRDGSNQLLVREFSRWGGRLEDRFTVLLAEALSTELETDRVSIFPWQLSAPIEYQVTVQVTSFDSDPKGRSTLIARWTLVEVRTQKVLVMARSTYREAPQPLAEGDEVIEYEAIAAAMSRDVARLGREIAQQIRGFSGS